MTIRSQLLFRLIVVSFILVGGTAWFSYEDVRQETEELFDAQLARSARLILSFVQAQNDVSGFSKIREYLDENGMSVMYIDFGVDAEKQYGHIYEKKLAFQIWDNEGGLVVKSYNAPMYPMTTLDRGFSDIVIGDFGWRTFSLLDSNQQYQCITAERTDVRNDLIIKISNDMFYMFIILIPALSFIMYISIDQVIRPLQRLSSQISRRSGDNLELITNDYKYAEIIIIKNTLNQLFCRLKETLAREKRTTSDAAHELRTPLAAIRLHTELAKTAKNRQEQNKSFDNVIEGVDRATHMVEQLLVLARLDPELFANDYTQINFTALIIEEKALLSSLAIDKEIVISFNDAHVHTISGNESSLRLLIRNLLKNAISYTPLGGNVNISLSKQEQLTILIIEDSGPGISEKDRERVMERFYRTENHKTQGCGIGLSIVNQVVKIHHGELRLCQADNGHGLKVIITFHC